MQPMRTRVDRVAKIVKLGGDDLLLRQDRPEENQIVLSQERLEPTPIGDKRRLSRRSIGARALLVHCETQEAKDFYQRLVPDFAASPTDPLHLYLLMSDLRRTIAAVEDLGAATEDNNEPDSVEAR